MLRDASYCVSLGFELVRQQREDLLAGGAQGPAKAGGANFRECDAKGLLLEQRDLLTVLVLADFDGFAHADSSDFPVHECRHFKKFAAQIAPLTIP